MKKVLARGKTSKKVRGKKLGCQVLQVSSIEFFGGSSLDILEVLWTSM